MRTDPSKGIPTAESTADVWVNWHQSLRKWFGKQEANTHWLRFWQQRAGAGSTADTHALRMYMEKQGLELTTTAWGEVTDSAAGVVDWFTDTVKITRVLLLGTVILGVGLLAFYFIKNTNNGKSVGEMALGLQPGKPLKGLAGTGGKLLGS